MGSSGKKRTTFAKLNREGRLREKRVEKEARKAARRRSALDEASEAVSRSDEFAEDSTRSENGPADAQPEQAAVSDMVSPGS